MDIMHEYKEKLNQVGLGTEAKYRFLLGPLGVLFSLADKTQLEMIAAAAATFIRGVDEWYREQTTNGRGHWVTGVMASGVPKWLLRFPWREDLPATLMIDAVWTSQGWKIVEIDVTNRNAMGYPLLMRWLYNLPSMWEGLDEYWKRSGWSETTQIMAEQHRFYEPYFRFFLSRINGTLLKESEFLEQHSMTRLLDLPSMFHSPHLEALALHARSIPIAIPPKHYLSSKAVLTLPWELPVFEGHSISEFLPRGHLLRKSALLPTDNFFVKLLQSGGAHGTFHNDRERLKNLALERRPQAIWQDALPIEKRSVSYVNTNGDLVSDDFYCRCSIFITPAGKVVDADVTASRSPIIHGSNQSIMTVPVLID